MYAMMNLGSAYCMLSPENEERNISKNFATYDTEL